MIEVKLQYFGLKTMCILTAPVETQDIEHVIHNTFKICNEQFYLLNKGKRLNKFDLVEDGVVHVVPRLCGGKGGFGSMLRAIGAQIEKTTNREACRDLSGRRLRDINEEQRLKNWIAQQAEREREALERKRKKLERLCREPKHEFNEESYDQQRANLTENISDSVEQGFKASVTKSFVGKRKSDETEEEQNKKQKVTSDAVKEENLVCCSEQLESVATTSKDVDIKLDKKKPSKDKKKLWIDPDIDDDSDSDSGTEEVVPIKN